MCKWLDLHMAQMTTEKLCSQLQLVGKVKKYTEDVTNPVCNQCGQLGSYVSDSLLS